MSEASPKERIGRFLTGQPIDRVPCVPLILNHAARVLGVKVSEYATNGQTMGFFIQIIIKTGCMELPQGCNAGRHGQRIA